MISLLVRSPHFLMISAGIHVLGILYFYQAKVELPSLALPKGTTILMIGQRPQPILPPQAESVLETEPEQKMEEVAPEKPEARPMVEPDITTETRAQPTPIVKPRRKPVKPIRPVLTKKAAIPQPKEASRLMRPATNLVQMDPHPLTATVLPTPAKLTEMQGTKDAASTGNSRLSDYRATIRAKLAENKRYPRAAKLRRVEGVVHVGFTLTANGDFTDLRILQSSGSQILDDETLRMVKRSGPFEPFPAEIRDPDMAFAFPVNYTIE